MTIMTPKKMHKGLLFAIFNFLICTLQIFNLASLFRYFGKKICEFQNQKWPLNATDANIRLINSKRNAADTYIILKWSFIVWITWQHYDSTFILILKWYFILANLQSFFYQIVWKEQKKEDTNADRLRRRMIHLFLAIFFSHLVFASIYRVNYPDNFNWKGGYSFYKSCLFSISNSFAGNYTGIEVSKDPVNTTLTIQFLISFIFVGVMIGKATPNYEETIAPTPTPQQVAPTNPI